MKDTRKDSPSCCKDNFCLVTSTVASNQYKIHSLNVKSAFLQGTGINRDVYVGPPKEAETTQLWKLQTTVYGLCDAPRVWYLSVKEVLKKSGEQRGNLIILYSTGTRMIIFKDDNLLSRWRFLLGRHKEFWGKCHQCTEKDIPDKSGRIENFKYFGLHIEQKQECIYLDQQIYIDELKEVQIWKRERCPRKAN